MKVSDIKVNGYYFINKGGLLYVEFVTIIRGKRYSLNNRHTEVFDYNIIHPYYQCVGPLPPPDFDKAWVDDENYYSQGK